MHGLVSCTENNIHTKNIAWKVCIGSCPLLSLTWERPMAGLTGRVYRYMVWKGLSLKGLGLFTVMQVPLYAWTGRWVRVLVQVWDRGDWSHHCLTVSGMAIWNEIIYRCHYMSKPSKRMVLHLFHPSTSQSAHCFIHTKTLILWSNTHFRYFINPILTLHAPLL